MPKASTIGIYASIFALIVAVVAVGYRPPQEVAGVANASPVTTDASTESTSVSEVVATTLAANLAQSTNLSIAPNALEFAVSAQVKSEFLQTDTTVISKPEIVQLTAENRTVQTYTAKSGDTVTSVAAQYGITADTVKWANNLTSDTLAVGKVLTILPIDGVQYTVKDGDALQSISEQYSVDQTRTVLYNDLDESGIKAGQKLILPNAVLPESQRPGYVAPTYVSSYASYSNTSVGNSYFYGYCTWYAYDRRAEMGIPIGGNWGNAYSWASAANSTGYSVSGPAVSSIGVPKRGAIMQTSSGGGGYGHVSIVENVAANGDVTVSEMNYVRWAVKSTRTISAGQAALYNYIY